MTNARALSPVASPAPVSATDRAELRAFMGNTAPLPRPAATSADVQRQQSAMDATVNANAAPHKRGKRERHAHYGLTALRALGAIQGTGDFYTANRAIVDDTTARYATDTDDGDARAVLAKVYEGAQKSAQNTVAKWTTNADRLLNADRATRACAAAELDAEARARALASYRKACDTADAKNVKIPARASIGKDATTNAIKVATKLVRAAITLA